MTARPTLRIGLSSALLLACRKTRALGIVRNGAPILSNAKETFQRCGMPSDVIPNVVDRDLSASSWPGLSPPSTSLIQLGLQALDAPPKAGHDESGIPRVG